MVLMLERWQPPSDGKLGDLKYLADKYDLPSHPKDL
jgi:hypothetical protein